MEVECGDNRIDTGVEFKQTGREAANLPSILADLVGLGLQAMLIGHRNATYDGPNDTHEPLIRPT